jgi:prevent-host-death family protein
METTVGIRDLKAHLSEYIQRVKSGQSIVVTDHGKPVGRILPVGMSLEDQAFGCQSR